MKCSLLFVCLFACLLCHQLTRLLIQVWIKLGLTRASGWLMQFCPILPNLPFASMTVNQYSFTVERQDHVSTGRWLVSSIPMQVFLWKYRNNMPPTPPSCFFPERTGPPSQKLHLPPRRVLQLLPRPEARHRQVQHQVQTKEPMKTIPTAFRPALLLV